MGTMNKATPSSDMDPELDSPDTHEKDGLTGIPERIHCTATEDGGGSELDELDRIDIDNFLEVLAQVALSVAARRAADGQGEGN